MAWVLADGHRRLRTAGATHVLSDEATARAAVEAAVADGPGLVAVDGSDVLGFMVVPLPGWPGTTTARLGMTHHAARPDEARLIYRRLYEAAAAVVVKLGLTYHSLPVHVEHGVAVGTFFELEFGVDQIDGILPIPEHADQATSGDVRPAEPADVDSIVELAIELAKYHARSPMFQVALLDVPSIRQGVENSLSEPRSAVVVAESGGQVVAMAQAEPDRAYHDAFDIGMNVVTATARGSGLGTAMLDHLVRWGSEIGYRYCTVGWTSSNLASDAFYRSRGFSPTRYRLHRRIDTRVAWANEHFDYTAFRQCWPQA